MQKKALLLFFAACVGIIVLRELAAPASENLMQTTTQGVMRLLFDMNTDAAVKDACEDVEFDAKPTTPADSVIDSITESRKSEKPLLKYTEDNDFMPYIMSLLQYCIPWAVFFIGSLIGFPIYCCCNYGCCSGCCKYPEGENAKAGVVAKFVYMILFLASSTVIIALAIVGLVYAAPIPVSYKMLKCSMYLMINEALYGAEIHFSPKTTWVGVSNIIKDSNLAIDSIKANQAAFAEVGSMTLGTNSYTSSESVLNAIANEFDSTNANWGVTDPRDGAQGYKVDIRTGWKSYTLSTSQMNDLYVQRIFYKDVVFKQMTDLKAACQKASQSNELDSAKSALNEVSGFTKDIESAKTDVYDAAKAGDDYVPIVQLVFTIYYVIVLACAAAMVVGTLLFVMCKCNRCRCLGHLGWGFQAFFMIIGFLLATILFPVSVVLIDACDLITLESLSTNHKLVPEDAWNQIGICLTGNGDLYTKYKLDEKIGFAADSMKAFDILDSIYNATTGELRYNYTEAFVSRIMDWAEKDCSGAAPSIFNAKNLLEEASRNCKGDLIVWGKDACTGSGSKPILSTDGSTNGGLCIPIRTYTKSNIDTALGTRYDGCAEYKAKVKNLVAYAEDLANLLYKMKESADGSLKSAMNSDNDVAQVKPIVSKAAILKIKVGDQISALTKNLQTGLNCLFLRDTYNRLYSAVCGYFTPMLTSIALMIVLVSLLDIIAIITLTCVNRKFWEEPKDFVSPNTAS